MTIWSYVCGEVLNPPRLMTTRTGIKYFEFNLRHNEKSFQDGKISYFSDSVTISVFDTTLFNETKKLRYGTRLIAEGPIRDRKLGSDRDVRINATSIRICPDIEM